MKRTVEVKKNAETKVRIVFHAAKGWCSENKEVIVAIAPTLIAASIELIKIAVKGSYVKEEKRLKENYIYDRLHGHYYETCRKPTNKEWLMIDERLTTGFQNVGTILLDMGLLK